MNRGRNKYIDEHLANEAIRILGKRPAAKPKKNGERISLPVRDRGVRMKKLGRVDGLIVYLVCGEAVRNSIDLDFTQGGNEAVYPKYVPAGEIWIDDNLTPHDRTATILHEIVERHLMMKYGLDYDNAHEIASANEHALRLELMRRPSNSIDLRKVNAALRAFKKNPKRIP